MMLANRRRARSQKELLQAKEPNSNKQSLVTVAAGRITAIIIYQTREAIHQREATPVSILKTPLES